MSDVTHQKVDMGGYLCGDTNSIVQLTDDGECPYCGEAVLDD